MPNRAEMLAVAADARVMADELAAHVHDRFCATQDPRNDEIIATLIGLRARNGLRAVLALGGEGVDDQLGILGRALTEGVIDLQYLRTATTRQLGKGRTHFLRTIEKEELFLTSGIIAEERIRGQVLTVPPAEVERARALREGLEIGPKPTYWHGARGTKAVLDELREAPLSDVEKETLAGIYHMFTLFSFNTHTSPHHTAYFEEPPAGGWPWRIKDQFLADEVLAGCVLLAIQTIRLWGLAVDHDVTSQASELVGRLSAAGAAAS